MKKILATLLFAISSAACADINLYGPGPLIQLCRKPAALYTQKTGVPVTVHYGPQAKWNGEAHKKADILTGPSEQSALATVRDHKDNFSGKDIGPLYLRKNILLVKKGNPKNIRGLEDLPHPGIGIIVYDGGGTSYTSGTGVREDIAGRKGNIDTVAGTGMRRNIILHAPNRGTARKALETQTRADVWITWTDWVASNPGNGDVVEIAPDYAIWRDMNIAVRKDASPQTRHFATWLSSDKAAPAFNKFGWFRQTVQ